MKVWTSGVGSSSSSLRDVRVSRGGSHRRSHDDHRLRAFPLLEILLGPCTSELGNDPTPAADRERWDEECPGCLHSTPPAQVHRKLPKSSGHFPHSVCTTETSSGDDCKRQGYGSENVFKKIVEDGLTDGILGKLSPGKLRDRFYHLIE